MRFFGDRPLRAVLRGGLCLCVLTVVVLAGGPARPAVAQWAQEEAWQPLLEHEGLRFRYLFYRKANDAHNGLVMRLTNTNAHPVRYRFTVVFRAEDREHEEEVAGRLDPGEDVTGDRAGLFWVPFRDGTSIAEVGLRRYRVVREDEVP